MAFLRLSQFQGICALRASTKFSGTGNNHQRNQLLFSELAHGANCMLTKVSTPHAHEISCTSLIRLEAVMTCIVDSLRPSNRETNGTRQYH